MRLRKELSQKGFAEPLPLRSSVAALVWRNRGERPSSVRTLPVVTEAKLRLGKKPA